MARKGVRRAFSEARLYEGRSSIRQSPLRPALSRLAASGGPAAVNVRSVVFVQSLILPCALPNPVYFRSDCTVSCWSEITESAFQIRVPQIGLHCSHVYA